MTKTQISTVLLASVLVAGCTGSTPAQNPTHRWASTSAADEVQYRNDHAKCQVQANIGVDQDNFETDSPGFAAYRACMNNRGYVLTAYRSGNE